MVRYWCDVVVAEPGVSSYVRQACKEEGAAAKIAEGKKRSAWRLLKPRDVELYPLAFESSGRVGASLAEFLHMMEKSSTGGPPAISLLDKLSVAMIRANVQLVRNAASNVRRLDVVSG